MGRVRSIGRIWIAMFVLFVVFSWLVPITYAKDKKPTSSVTEITPTGKITRYSYDDEAPSNVSGLISNTQPGPSQNSFQSRSLDPNEKGALIFLTALIFICVGLVFGIIGIVKGCNHTATFFYNWGDFIGTTFLLSANFVLLWVGGSNADYAHTSEWQWIAIGTPTVGVLLNFLISFNLNKSKWNALCVFFGRLIIGFFGLFMMMGLFLGGGRRSDESDVAYQMRRSSNQISFLIVGFGFFKLAQRLVNGTKIRKGEAEAQ